MIATIDTAEVRLEALRLFVTGAEVRDGVLHCPNVNAVRAELAEGFGMRPSDSRLHVVVRQVRELVAEAARPGAYKR